VNCVTVVGDVIVFLSSRERAIARASRKGIAQRTWWIVPCIALVGAASMSAGTSILAHQNSDPDDIVTRADIPLIALPEPVSPALSDPVSHQLRLPVRVTDRSARRHDLGALVTDALAVFDVPAGDADRLHVLLVRTLAEGQSDLYIDAVLNAALARGEFNLPPRLVTAAGRLDTDLLLQTVLEQVAG
jgi:hypothetical protein